KVAQVRARKADNSYPEKVEAPGNLASTYQLKEDGANPDQPLKSAGEFLAAALAAVIAGKLADSRKAKEQAEAKAAEASGLVDTVLAAETYVRQQVPNVRTALGKLAGEIPGGETDVAALNAGFLKQNFDGQPVKVTQAKTVNQSTEAELTK